MNKKIILLTLTFTLLITISPGFCNSEIFKEYITDEKLPVKESYFRVNIKEYRNNIRAKKKSGKSGKGNLGTNSTSNCPVCSNPICPSTQPNTCPAPNSFINALANRYRFNISVIAGLTDTFELNIQNINPQSGVFTYTAKNLRTGIVQSIGVGHMYFDNVNFTLATTNIPNFSGDALIHTLDCTGFLNNDSSISGICSTVGQNLSTLDLGQIVQEFEARVN